MNENIKCDKCEKNNESELHFCPYKTDVYQCDNECNCCYECFKECEEEV